MRLASAAVALCAAAVLAAGAVKALAWRAQDALLPASASAVAVGLAGRASAVRPLDPPTTSDTYLQREMGFRIARRHARKLRRLAGLIGIAVPLTGLLLALVAPGPVAAPAILAALAAAMTGALVERWLFFAEATHKVALYHGTERV